MQKLIMNNDKFNDIDLKENSDDYVSYLKNNGVMYLYHFTSKKNIESIKQNCGILSYYQLMKNEIEIPCPGGDKYSQYIQDLKGLSNYVYTCLCDSHPMFYNKDDIVPLMIDIDVVRFKGTLFSNMNSLCKDANIDENFYDLQQINIWATKRHFRSGSDYFKMMQAEILVPDFIPISFIINIDEYK